MTDENMKTDAAWRALEAALAERDALAARVERLEGALREIEAGLYKDIGYSGLGRIARSALGRPG